MDRLLKKQFEHFKNSTAGKAVLTVAKDADQQEYKVKTAFANGANVAICTVVISFIETMSKEEKKAIYEYIQEELNF